VEKTDKPKKPKGRAFQRVKFKNRFQGVSLKNGKNKGPNSKK